MKKQCNLCGLREDLLDLVSINKTWCLVHNKEVDNKFQNCEYWYPDGPSIRSQKVKIANEIRSSIKPQINQNKGRMGSSMENTLSSESIWDEIQSDFGINKRAFGKKINFVTDKFKKKIIFRDIEHAYILANSGFSKPSVILAGGVIEELLRLYLKYKNIKPDFNNFISYVTACEKNGLLKSAIHKLTDSIRYFRNIVHLENEKTQRHTISKATAKGAVSSIFTLANDF
jgi:hypothetical protein